MRRWLANAFLYGVVTLLLFEGVFRFIFPACELPSSIQSTDGFLLFDPHYQRSGYHSSGLFPNQSSMCHWTINNDGWNSTFRYRPNLVRDRPLIAVIGDSAVEGFWSDVEDHIDTWLYYLLKGEFDVYAFGRRAQPLAQMMLLMERVDSLYKPDVFVMIIGHEAIFSSLDRGEAGEYHYLLPVPLLGTFFIAEPPVVEPSALARTAMRSALVRYVRLHLLQDLFTLMTIVWQSPDLNASLSDESISLLLPAAGRYMLTQISHTLGDRRLLVVSDNCADRFTLYGDYRARRVVSPWLEEDLSIMDCLCRDYANIDYISIQSAFEHAYDTTGARFEAADNRHLSGYGNFIAANAIARRLESSGTLRRAMLAQEAEERHRHRRNHQGEPAGHP